MKMWIVRIAMAAMIVGAAVFDNFAWDQPDSALACGVGDSPLVP